MGYYVTDRKNWRHIQVPVELYAYIKAVALVREIPQHDVVADMINKYREGIDEVCAHAFADYHWMDDMGATFDDGEWYMIIDDEGSTRQYSRIGVEEFRTRVEEEYQKALKNIDLSYRIARDRAIKADHAKRKQAGAAVAGPAGAFKGGSC